MSTIPFVYIISQKWRIILGFAILGMVVAAVVSLIIPPKYRSSTQILITQHYGQNADIYASAKFTEYLSNVLREVVYSKSFFDQVIYSGFGVRNDFPVVVDKWLRTWKRTIVTKVISNTGIITIDVYHVNRDQADRIANAIAAIMVNKSDQYTGAGNTVSVRVIDGPSTTDKTVYPNIWLNLVVGLLSGLVFGSIFIYLFPEAEPKGVLSHSNHSLALMSTQDFGQSVYDSVMDSTSDHNITG